MSDRIVTVADLYRVGHVACGDPSECWEWQGARGGMRYGSQVMVWGKRRRPHVAALILTLGRELRPGMQANHSCDNPLCTNVSEGHVYEGTQAENMRDRLRKTTCSRGHEYTPENTRVLPDGHRRCRACDRIREARRTRRLGGDANL